MSLATYDQLKTAVASWIARDELTATIPDFITLAEAEFNRKLRTRQMEITQATTPSSGQFSLPTDYLAWKKVTWVGSTRRELQYVHPSAFSLAYPSSPGDTPVYFTVSGTTDGVGSVKIMPTSSTVIDFTYYQKVTSLSTANTSNWLLSAHPDAYLAGSIVEAHGFLKDYEQASVWASRRDRLLDEITSLDQKTRGPSAIFVSGYNP